MITSKGKKLKRGWRFLAASNSTLIVQWFNGYFNYWILKYNNSCNQFTGYLNVWNTLTINGWNNIYKYMYFSTFFLIKKLPFTSGGQGALLNNLSLARA
jgi:hypothetical protein